jgi:hypothetical protein
VVNINEIKKKIKRSGKKLNRKRIKEAKKKKKISES